MTSQIERDHLRKRLLVGAHAFTDGDTRARFRVDDIAPADADTDELARAAEWLRENEFFRTVNLAGQMSITAHGVNTVEEALRKSEVDTDNPSDLADLEEGDGLYLIALSNEARLAVEAVLGEFDRSTIVDMLEGDDLATYESDRTTVGAQIRSPNPRRRIVRDGLRNMWRAARGLGVEITATAMVKALKLD